MIVPTLNEAATIGILAGRLRIALSGVDWELIVVDDDSSDGTWRLVKDMARSDQRVRCLRRVGRRGLSGACIEGVLASSAPFVAVIDGDLQHDEMILPMMLRELREGGRDVVVGTRHGEGGADDILAGNRARISHAGRWLSLLIVRPQVSDPMSGFFMARRPVIEDLAPRLSVDGFKILVDLLAGAPSLRVGEIAYVFRPRPAGASKLRTVVLLDYLGIVLHHATGGVVPVRFVLFGLVGASGLLVHLAALFGLLWALPKAGFPIAELGATAAAIASNFLLNNALTYGDCRHSGFAMVVAFARFSAVCGVGALSNVAVATWIYGERPTWWLAGSAGALTGAVWNYGASTALVWPRRQTAGAPAGPA